VTPFQSPLVVRTRESNQRPTRVASWNLKLSPTWNST